MADAPWARPLSQLSDLTSPMAIRVAATLRLADHITAGTTSVIGLARASAVNTDALGRLLRHLAAVGVVSPSGPDHYELTGLGKELVDSGPGDTRSWLDLEAASSQADLAVFGLLEAVRTGRPAETQDWSDLDGDPALSDSFDEAMAAVVAAKAPGLIAGYDWGSVEHVVDVGGGNGALLIALLGATPSLRGTVVDRPGPVRSAIRNAAAAGLSDRLETSAQSFFDPLPRAGTVYLLSGVLHDWDDERAAKLLARCAEAGDTVLVMESLVTPGVLPSSTTEMDLMLLCVTGGRARSAADLAKLATPAGLRVKKVSALDGPHSLVEFTTK